MSSTSTRIGFRPNFTHVRFKSLVFPFSASWLRKKTPSSMSYSCNVAAVFSSGDESTEDSVEGILLKEYGIRSLMKMERRSVPDNSSGRWFPYLDLCRAGSILLASREVIEALEPCIMNARKERILRAVENRSYSVSLVVEGLMDFGNVSATFRSADALGIQSVHVISGGNKKRYKENRHVSKGAEKWLDIELWNSSIECFQALRTRGYRIATANLGMDTVSIYDLDWTHPTAIVVGNEHFGISHEALQLSDLNCSIPMKGMVDSFNVSVAAGILMHHAVSDRVSRLVSMADTVILLLKKDRSSLPSSFSVIVNVQPA
ncbi:hypothetical protein HPP92_006278 [Vanilla planifolia]|uniref:tRNA/rRNA methyltransferase SpoU type domain-containing protein n=1 Tax=Vanilla planifolia TaxID=51239 RepID=A0A835RQX7_VANPL|nr:hypothetical protein HPP92_006554 [Vanilla planifolia]KAG0495284.1 hypothetical protein HPP92_006278 [Vanilla planifolia]